MSVRTTTVTANGLQFVCLDEGPEDGPLFLLLHGFPDTAHSWDHIRPQLAAKGYRAVAPFMRGYAPTAIPDRDADMETLARDALGLIEAFGRKDAVVLGYDWGATAAYGAATLDPARVKKLIVLGIPHPATLKITPRAVWGVRHFIAYKLPGAARRFAKNDFAALPAIMQRWSPKWRFGSEELAPVRACFADPRSLDAALGYYRALSFRPPIFLRRKIEVPTIAFAGTDDKLVSPQDFVNAARMFANAYVIERTPGAHFLHREFPDEFASRLLGHV